MKVLVSLTPWPSERQYDMPGDETRSLLYRLGESLIAATAYADDSRRSAPDSEIPELILEFWAEETARAVSAGDGLTVWYGSDIGAGVVQRVLA